MITDYKRLLIVDDSEIDRAVLKNILQSEFDVIEADNGYAALEIILKKKMDLDAILLDVSMPVLDGFNVLQFLKENKVSGIPVFLITAEATKTNVEKAAQYNIVDFIRKPYDQKEVLRRLKSKLNIAAAHELSDQEISETTQYISSLKEMYKKYLSNVGKDDRHYVRMADLMKILLDQYCSTSKRHNLDDTKISLISQSAYFCDIGRILLPDPIASETENHSAEADSLYRDHPLLGADIIRLNYSKDCEYFVHICADMCSHHHERFDGNGFPDGISGHHNSVYNQMCHLADIFDHSFYECPAHDAESFDSIVDQFMQDTGAVSEEIFSLLTACKSNILTYYAR